jgi:hypothetical protein
VIAPEERFESEVLGPSSHGQLVVVGQALLGLEHDREAHPALLVRA